MQSYNIIQLFLLANLLTSTSTIPVLMGLWHTPLGLKVRAMRRSKLPCRC